MPYVMREPVGAATRSRWILNHWPWLLVLSVFPLFLTGASYHVPLGLMALLGIGHILGNPRHLRDDPGARLILALFLALWIPQLVALPGAAVPRVSLEAAARYLVYPLAAVFMLGALRPADRIGRVTLGAAAVVAVWSLDHMVGPAGLDLGSGRDVGVAYWGGLLFDRSTVGPLAAVVSPLVFELVRRNHRKDARVWIWPAFLTMLVLLSGRRGAWLMFAVSGTAYVAYLAMVARRFRWRTMTIVVGLLTLAAVVVYAGHDLTRERVQVTLDLLSEDRGAVDLGTSYRLDIWTTTLSAARANWPRGVGTLGSRHVYAEYASPDDFWLRHGYPGALHPHQFILEIAAETGLAGLLGYLLAWTALIVAVVRSREPWAWACGIALAVAILPLNAHISFYGSYWSMLIWWVVGLTAAALGTRSSADGAVAIPAP